MSGVFSIGGVYLPDLALVALVALLPFAALQYLMSRLRLFRFIWHRALFEVASYVAIVGLLDYYLPALIEKVSP